MIRDRFGIIGFFMAAAAAMARGPALPISAVAPRREERRVRDWRKGGANVPHQGKQEIARRRRHIECGLLREQNGLLRAVG